MIDSRHETKHSSRNLWTGSNAGSRLFIDRLVNIELWNNEEYLTLFFPLAYLISFSFLWKLIPTIPEFIIFQL